MKILPRGLLLLIMLPCATTAHDFRKPDYDSIRRVTQDKSSAYYYPGLLARYQESDTTLTDGEYRALYFGFLFQPGYTPYTHSAYADSVRALFAADSLAPADFPLLIHYEKQILLEDPFSLRDLNILSYVSDRMGDTVTAIQAAIRLGAVAQTILFSGDGKTEETAWHVIHVSHEYDLLNLLGFSFTGPQSLTTGGCDYLQVGENQFGISGFYFDVNRILEAEKKALQDPSGRHAKKRKKKEQNP
jgi:hypothetical protein